MSKGLKITSWVLAIAMVVACYGTFIFPDIVSNLLGESEAASYVYSGESASTLVFYAFLIIVPILEVACIVVGIIAARSKANGAVRTTRAIMLTVKLSLIPFFIGGGIMIFALFIIGIHPILIAFGWGGAAVLSICGWITMVSGSIWSIATAVQLRRLGRITSGEMAVHIVLQFFFVADVIDAIILFVKSAPPKSIPYQSLS